jgi:methionyl-tRNA synthetase
MASAADAWEHFAPQRALEATWELIGSTNAYLETHAPWKMEPGDAVDAVMGDALESIRLVAILISPAMPSVADEIWRRLGLQGSPTAVPFTAAVEWGQYPGGLTVTKGESLFPRIQSDQ